MIFLSRKITDCNFFFLVNVDFSGFQEIVIALFKFGVQWDD